MKIPPSGSFLREDFKYYVTGTFPRYSFPEDVVWFCEYCEQANPRENVYCGEGKPYGCGAPRYSKEKPK